MKRLIILSAIVLFAISAKAQTTLYPVSYAVSSLPSASTMKGRLVNVSDPLDGRDCTTGGGSAAPHGCKSDGTKWAPWGGGTDEVSVDDYGAVGNGSTDDHTAIQAAVDAVANAGGGTVKFSRGKTYVSSVIDGKSKVKLDGNFATLNCKSSARNFCVSVSNNVLNSSRAVASDQKAGTTSLSSALADGTSVTVGSTTGILAGDRIIVSSGPFTGSGVEHGPWEWATVQTVTDATHLALVAKLRYSHTGLGITGAAPFVQTIGPESSMIRDVRIANFFFDVNGSDNPLYFGINNTENVEIDHIVMRRKGASVWYMGYSSRVYFHDNAGSGASANGDSTTAAGLVDSRIVDNEFNFLPATSTTHQENAMVCEVGCRDNVVARNRIYGIGLNNGTIGLNFTLGAFNNQIIDNWVFGVGLSNSYDTWGIRTYESNVMSSFGGNIIVGNILRNVLQGIGDSNDGSVIGSNQHWNDSSASFSKGVVTNSASNINLYPNSFKNITSPLMTPSSTVPIVRHQWGWSSDYEGNGSPEGVVTANVGSLYRRLDGGTGTSVYIKESGTGNTGWVVSGTGANGALSNLASVAVNTSLLPGTTNSIDLGSTSKAWRDGYFSNSVGIGTLGSADFSQYKFQVKDNVNSGISFPLAVANLATTGGNGNGVGMDFWTRDNVGSNNRIVGSIEAQWVSAGNNQSKISFHVKNGGSDRVEVLTALYNGNVGIGTTSPTSILTVQPGTDQTVNFEGDTFNAQTGTSYTVVSGDSGKVLTFSNGSAIAVTLPQATGGFSAFDAKFGTIGAGTVTITPTTSTIDATRVGGTSAQSTLTIASGKSVRLVASGGNYIAYNDAGRY